jgi:hypothetical protein
MTQHPALRGNGYAVSRDLYPRLIDIDPFRPLGRETRKHPPKHTRKLKASLEQFGFVLPIIIDELNRVVAGWGLVLQVPAVTLSGLREAELRTLRLALNRLGEDSRWDTEALALEFSDIFELEPEAELQISGFEIEEIEELLDSNGTDEGPELRVLANDAELVTRPGDLWVLGPHKVLCADARDPKSYDRLLGGEKAWPMRSGTVRKNTDSFSIHSAGSARPWRLAVPALDPAIPISEQSRPGGAHHCYRTAIVDTV